MSKTIKGILIAGLMGLSVSVSALTLKADAPQTYVVKKGDTLWGISERFTSDPWQWPEIWYQNDQIKNPHLIYPGDEIGLVEINGETRLTVTRRGDASRTYKMSPGTVKMQPTARVEPIESAIPAIPQDAIQGFLKHHRVVELEDLDKAPRVLAGADGRLIMGAGGKVYARGDFGDEVANAYGIYRKGQVYVDPETEEVLGLEATEIGVGSVAGKEGNIATLLLERTAQQVSIGDVLLPTDDRELISNYYPRAPKGKLTGEILAVDGGVSQVGQFDVVVLNRGERDGLEPGSVLLIMKKGEIVYDRIKDEQVRLPSERAGSLMVFLTYEKMSYALIMRANRPLRIGDEVVNPNN
ncbi:MAG: peptidoglycan-binding protein [Oceanospirillaceae bacterium]|uniref:LysM peptidoglycan-binding domain-containing protein n=1 Tax=unclassified Thalassolituus TaxID=2624967 RepID=UPI000C090058|nr:MULTISPECIES: LysM domain-containing protein [unclassified Thalassolituus]MAK90838.1 peptidoglycan-binding protein [Thalassolituus sp.]MAS25817.1 peptidoglycan-binding protein [Oceanospirillaceae bacterium]MAX98549.1 peptidoglycan-binding protein [Oceanospirillaceae bacterium]MBL35450.1 peptidoglycan-binding protein [Oceanospirillaceae bacterium]|tara:strand:+ start:13220 stop:14281 length:1062 start_codon:yes stop_codon:yes gene_type:complete